MARKIERQTGYPTTDGKLFDKYQDAVKHQVDLDLVEASKAAGTVVSHKDFIIANPEIVSDFIKHHCKAEKKAPATKKPAAKKSCDK